MNVNKVVPSGYCKGVINAIKIAKDTRTYNPSEPIFVLGNLVHNFHVTKTLETYNIKTLDDTNKTKEELLDEIESGIVILTAHGTADSIKEKAIKKGLKVVDGTCIDVLNTKNLIIEYLSKGYDVIYFGKPKHPEANAIISLSNNIHLIASLDDIDKLNINNNKIVFTNQTTMSFIELKEIVEKLQNKYKNIKIIQEICNATSMRQKAILDLKDCDVLYIVGDKSSNNTNKLVEIAKNNGINNVYLINDYKDIKKDNLNNNLNVYVSAGASTPTELIDEVIEYLKNLTF